MKKCTRCGIEKELTEFYKEKRNKNGLQARCKICHLECKKESYKNNRENALERTRNYYQRNKEKYSEYERERRQNDPIFRMKGNYRRRTNKTYKNKAKRTMELLGCTGIELANHLEKQFQPGMTHDNYGEWHIDHIRPIASFDLSDPKEAEKCFHYTNLQPLWAADNLSKGDSY